MLMRVSMRDILLYNAGTPAELKTKMGNVLINNHSASICTMDDGNSDTGIHCTSAGAS